jgi:hypothetical protein
MIAPLATSRASASSATSGGAETPEASSPSERPRMAARISDMRGPHRASTGEAAERAVGRGAGWVAALAGAAGVAASRTAWVELRTGAAADAGA